jgi:hypothetical protein
MASTFRAPHAGLPHGETVSGEFQGADRLSEALVREFDAPVGLLDPLCRRWLARRMAAEDQFPDPIACLRGLSAQGSVPLREATLWSPQGLSGITWLVLPISDDAGREAWALAGFAPVESSGRVSGPWGPSCPRRALRLWGTAVVEDLRARMACRTQSRPSLPSSRSREGPLLDRLIRRLRVSDSPEKFQRLAIASLRDELGVELVAWVPTPPRDPVLISHESEVHKDEVFRALLSDSLFEPVRVLHRPASAPSIEQAIVVASDADNPSGWLIAINPVSGRTPGRACIELLQLVAQLISAHRSNARLYSELKDLLFGVIRSLTSAIDAKDPYTCGHSERVARIAVRLAEHLGISASQRGDLYLMGLLHDVGKIGVDDQVLKKPGKLTDEEYKAIQAHVRIGVQILSDLKKLNHLLPGVAHHHESWDGTGYPSGLAGEAIPLMARILAVADGFDAMSSTRPYRRRLSPNQIDQIFREGSGTQWDPRVVDALFACRADLEQIRQKGLGESLNRVVDDQIGRS